MTMQVKIKDQYMGKFKNFISSLPNDAVEVEKSLEDDSISFEQAQIKVKKALNNISLSKAVSLDEAFEKVENYGKHLKL